MNKSEEGKADKRLFSGMSSLDGKYLIGGILDFLSFRELRPLSCAVRNKHIRESLKESVVWKRCLLSSMSYSTYLDQLFIRLNEEMYWPVFQDVFANDIKNFENKLASIEISDEIRDKFAFNNDCGKIVSQAMYFWVKIMSMENIAFDMLALTQQDFDDYYLKQNDGYCSDIRERKIDLNLWEVVKDILSKSSKGRVDKIFNKFKDRQIGDYEIETFDSYAKESGKKFDECENREIVWLNLCATLKENIKNEYFDLENKAGWFNGLTFGCNNRFGQVYDAVKSIYSLENAFAAYLFLFNPSDYKKFVEGLISKHKELQDMKNWIRNGFYTQRYKIDAAKLIEDSKTWRDIFEYAMSMYNHGVFNKFSRNYISWYIKDKASVGAIKQSKQEESYIIIMSMLFANSPDKINSVIDTAFLNGVKKNINAICENGKIVVIKQKYSDDYIQYFEKNETWNKSEDTNKYEDDTAIYEWTFNGSADKVLADLNLASEKMASLEQNSNNANIENDNANIYEQWRNKVESQLKSCKKYLMSDHAPEFVQNDSRNSNFINNFTKINQEQPTSLYIDDIIKDMQNNERYIQNYIDGKSTEVENDQEDSSDKSEVERKNKQNMEIQENINVGETNNNRPNNIEIKNEPVTNKNDRNTDKNRTHDKKIDLNGSNSENTNKFKDVNNNVTIDGGRNDREEHGNKDRVKNSLRIKSKNSDIANENQNDTKKNESDINSNQDSLNEIKYEQQSMSMKKDKNKNQNVEKDNSIDDKNKNENISNRQSENGKDGELKIKDKNKSEIKYENPNNKQVTKSQHKPTVLWIILAIIFSPTVIPSIIFIGLAIRSYKFNCELEESLSQTLENNHEENKQNDKNKSDDDKKSRIGEPDKSNFVQMYNEHEEPIEAK